jgi:hypothetical protein
MKAIAVGVITVAIAVFSVVMIAVVTPAAFMAATFHAAAKIPPGNVPPEAAMPRLGPIPNENPAWDMLVRPWYGSPYDFGGDVRSGVDCSGFTVAVYRQLGVNLPRTAQSQYNVARKVDTPRVGDLVFFYGTYDSRPDFISHVGIFLGGDTMVSAVVPSLGQQSLSSAYWRSHFVSFGRIL